MKTQFSTVESCLSAQKLLNSVKLSVILVIIVIRISENMEFPKNMKKNISYKLNSICAQYLQKNSEKYSLKITSTFKIIQLKT